MRAQGESCIVTVDSEDIYNGADVIGFKRRLHQGLAKTKKLM